MDIAAAFRRRQRDQRQVMAGRLLGAHDRHATEDADTRSPAERLADAVSTPAAPPAAHDDFNAAVRVLASTQDDVNDRRMARLFRPTEGDSDAQE